jgi:hypothetical protein
MIIGAFTLTCALKLIPVYIEGATVSSAISSAIEKGEFEGLSVGRIKSKVGKIFEINMVEGISAKDVKIKRSKGLTTLDANYEQRMPLMFNIDVVVKFDKLTYEFKSGSSY